ncbi:MAG: alpha/beta hydrolase family protein [Syntrophobacteraceae bacterium]
MGNRKDFLIEAGDIKLSAVVHLPDKPPAPVIVCCHGLLSLKESPKFVQIGEEMSKAGFTVLRFDFSGCGESPHRNGASLIETRRCDLDAALDFASSQAWSTGQLGLLGSSLGGYLSLLAAENNQQRVLATVSWAAPFDVSNIHPDSEGFSELSGMYPGGFRLGLPENLESLNSLARVLLIHGQEDEIVDWRQAVQIYSRVKDPKELLLMRTADHQISDESWRKAAIRASLDWFRKYLKCVDRR